MLKKVVNVEDDRMKYDKIGPLVVNPPAMKEPKSPFSGGLKGIAGVLSSIFDEESLHFFAQKSAKLKNIGSIPEEWSNALPDVQS